MTSRQVLRSAASAVLVLTATSLAQTRPAKPAKGEPPPALAAAVAALTDEFAAVVKDPALSLRTDPDYFAGKPTEGLDAAALLTALGKPLHADVRCDAYIKWQLLSARAEAFDGPDAKTAGGLFRRLTPLPPRLGTTVQEQAALTAAIDRLNEEQVLDANRAWQTRLDQQLKTVAPMMTYREELYRRLPKTPEVFAAAFADLEQRVQAGYEVLPRLKTVAGDVRHWAIEASAADVRAMSRFVLDQGGREGAKGVKSIAYDKKQAKAVLRLRTVTLTRRTCDQLAEDLLAMAKSK